jgi:septum formation protein
MFQFKRKIVLGSGSPRRQLLLRELGIHIRIVVGNTDETPLPGLVKNEIAEYLSKEKSKELLHRIHEDEILVTADTIVWVDTFMLGKPENVEHAFEMLKILNGRSHRVFTGITIATFESSKTFSVESEVFFKKLTIEEIQNYIEVYKPFDKAGAYGAQECLPDTLNPLSQTEINFLNKNNLSSYYDNTKTPGLNHIPFIERIDGSFFNVMGLPIVELVNELESVQ